MRGPCTYAIQDRAACTDMLLKFVCFADAEAATIPFINRYNVTLAHFQSVHLQEIIADNGLQRFDKWFKVRLSSSPSQDLRAASC